MNVGIDLIGKGVHCSSNHIIISEYISIILRLCIIVNQYNMDISVYLFNY